MAVTQEASDRAWRRALPTGLRFWPCLPPAPVSQGPADARLPLSVSSVWSAVSPSASTHPSRPSSNAPASQKSSNSYSSHLHLGFPSFMLRHFTPLLKKHLSLLQCLEGRPVSFSSIFPTKSSTKLVISWCPVDFVELY